MNALESLRQFTEHVRETKGTREALLFYIDYIQPLKIYFGGE